jgi:hypothetical protein
MGDGAMKVTRAAAAVLMLMLSAGCVATDRPTTKVVMQSVEEQKKDVAVLRDRGQISFEEAARRQFEIQRANYALTEGEFAFWRASIEYAMQVDRGQITRQRFFVLRDAAYAKFVGNAV